MKFKQITIVLLGFFLSIIAVSCSTSTIVDRSYEDYETTAEWELSNELSELSINEYIRLVGGHSIQIVNGGCGDLVMEESLDLEVVKFDLEDPEDPEEPTITPEIQTYEISFSYRRSPTDYIEFSPVETGDNLDEDAPPPLLGEDFSVIIEQASTLTSRTTILDEEIEIEHDLTWATTTFTFSAEKDLSTILTFRLGCELDILWIDSITFTNITPEPIPEVD